MSGHVGVERDRQADRQCGALVAQGMTRVSEKGRPTPCKVLRLEDLPPFGHPLGAGTLLIDAPLRVSQLTSKDEPGQDTS